MVQLVRTRQCGMQSLQTAVQLVLQVMLYIMYTCVYIHRVPLLNLIHTRQRWTEASGILDYSLHKAHFVT